MSKKMNGAKRLLTWLMIMVLLVSSMGSLAGCGKRSSEESQAQESMSQDVENSKKEDSEKEDSKEEDSKKEDSKKEDSKKEDSKKEDSKKEDSKKEDSKKEDSKKEDSEKEESKPSGSGSTTPDNKYTITFNTNGGNGVPSMDVEKGAYIGALSNPYKEGHVFLGWYYDEALSMPVASTDTVTKDISVYAGYLEEAPLEYIETVNFASAVDVDTDFSIIVTSVDRSLSAEAVKAAILAEDLTDPGKKDIIQVSGSNGQYIIQGIGGFDAGSTYRITLQDIRLHFKDQPESVREYNFTTYQDEVLNLGLQDEIIYIPAEDLRNIINDGQAVSTLSIAMYEVAADGTISAADMSEGTFEYDGQLHVGDIVSVYEGLIPTERTLDTPKEQLGDLAYLKITGVNGNTYTYVNAQPEEVIFEPDVLPIPEGVDLDNNSATITVDDKYLDFSADFYAAMEMDSQTTVDVGDFITFYTGELGVTEGENAGALTGVYGKITAVAENGNGTTTITYVTVSWAEVESCMDIYSQQEVTAAELLEGVDVDAMEAEIEQQAIDSGFAEEAAQYLASLALATENFTKLSDNMNLEDYKITLEDGTPISPEELQLMSNNIQVDVEMAEGYPKAKIGLRPTHLGDIAGTNADKQGLVIGLEIQVVITIGKKGSDNQVEITITGEFVEELGLDVGAKSKTEWSFAGGIFPYISAYKLNANVDLVNYTAVSFNATMVTKEADDEEDEDDDDDDEEGVDIAEEIKGLLESMTGGEDEEDEEEAEENENKLVQHYSEMIKAESDWIKVVDANLCSVDQGVPPMLPIIRLGYSIDFVVQLDAAVSVGFDFEYLEGKRYIFSVNVTKGQVSSDTVTLQEQTYEFCFYAMGRLGIKAGVEMDFTVALLHKSVAHVGFQAGAGPYAKLWGYFFYELKYSESAGKSQKYSGALLIEVGVYFELSLKAEALGGYLSTEKSLIDKEWPLWSVGVRNNVLDFTHEQEEMAEIILKQHVRSAMLADNVFMMNYLDLMTGDNKDAIYGDWYDPALPESDKNKVNYVITMTNDKFTYDPQTNTIKVNPAEGDKKLEGEMIITWIKQPMTFTSKPIQRTISLYWDNLRDGYVIVPVSNGGTYIPLINKKFEAPVSAPADPEKVGYVFAGWYSDEELTVPYVFPELMPDVDAYIYAKWEPAKNTAYTVEHYQEQFLSGEYELVEIEKFTGTTDSYVTPAVKSYTGFNTPVAQEIKILPDGSTVLRYYYSIQRHTVTFKYGEVGGEDVAYELKYGADVVAPGVYAEGYTFAGWSVDGVNVVEPMTVMGTEDVVYTALWTEKPDTSYRVEYYVQQADGRYTLQHMFEAEAFTGTVITEETLRQVIVDGTKTADETYIQENAIAAENMTVKGMACTEAVVSGDGKTVIKINYSRVLHTLTFDLGYDGAQDVVKNVMYGAEIIAPQALSRTGYAFTGWSVDGVNVVTPIAVMGTEDVTYIALWQENDYTVRFHAGSDAAQGTMADLAFVYDQAQALSANAYTRANYTFAGWATQPGGGVKYADGAIVFNLTTEKDGVVDLYAVWTPVTYTISYEGADNAVHTNPASYTVESETIILADAVKTGYIFDGWYVNGEIVEKIEKGSAGNIVLQAQWTARTDTAYKAEHWQQQLDGSFVLAETDSYTGTTDTAVTPEVKNYAGFAAPEAATVNVSADGSTVVRYEYTRKSYTITLDPNGGSFEEGVSGTVTDLYEAEIILPTPVREGYGFAGWYVDETAYNSITMGSTDLTLTAKWVEGAYSYTVNHYKQNLDGETYSLAESETDTGLMDHVITPETKLYEGFTAPEQTQSITITVNAADNVVNYYYTRNQYDLSWAFDGGAAEDEGYTSGKVYYGAQITVPVLAKKGYSYSWDVAPVATMPAADLVYTAVWSVNSYNVSFDCDGGSVIGGSTQTRSVVYGTAYGELAVLEKNGYIFDGWAMADGTVVTAETVLDVDADHILYAQFTPITYNISYYNVEDATNTNDTIYTIESGDLVLTNAVKTGYNFKGWYSDEKLTVPVTVIAAGSTGNQVLYAKWEERQYTVVFHSNTSAGLSTEQTFSYTENKALAGKPAEFVKTGYSFAGWAVTNDGETAYADGATVGQLSGENNGVVHLYAVWTPIVYKIHYANMDGAVNAEDNPENFSATNNVFALHEPSKTGYTFEGWYLDGALTQKVEGQITLDSYHEWTFYAKWKANQYLVVFDSCLGIEVPTENLLMTYDEAANLTLFSEITAFSNPGYTFKGWSTVNGGSVMYADGETVKNLGSEQGETVTLYAVWDLNVFSITYNLGTGATANNSENPASYSIEDGDVKLAAPTAKTGYQFLGWYSGNTKVTEIVRGTQQDYTLTAKWAHGGIFTIAYTSRSSTSGGYNVTYTVTRTLPEGTVATPNPQIVYIRTVNGTAYGNTPEAATATGQNKYHFVHVDPVKEGSGILTFGETDFQKTIVIKELSNLNDNLIAAYQSNNTARYYNVELYRVLDTVGGCQGSLGSTKSVKRSLPVSDRQLTSNLYNWRSKQIIGSSAITITDSGYDKNDWRDIYPKQIMDGVLSTYDEQYRDLTATHYGFYFTFDLKENDDGYQWVKITNATGRGGSTLAEYHFATKDGEEASNWGRNLSLPRYNSSASGDILFNVGDCVLDNNWSVVNASTPYSLISLSKNMSICFDASGKKDDDWQYRNLYVYLKVYDNKAPKQQGLAPLALTQYKAGEQISLTVIYDEIIDYTFAVGFNVPSCLPIQDVKLVAGKGTNTLTFTATVTKDFEVTPNINNTLVNNTKPVTGTVEDISGNR